MAGTIASIRWGPGSVSARVRCSASSSAVSACAAGRHGLGQSGEVERCSAEVDQGAVVQFVLAWFAEVFPGGLPVS